MKSKLDLPALLPSMVFGGFAAGLIVWCTWFTTHIPWLGLHEQVALPLVVLSWFFSLIFFARLGERPLITGVGSGLVSAMVTTLILGSKLKPEADAAGQAPTGLVPGAALIVLGFIATGAILGLVAGSAASAISSRNSLGRQSPWLGRFSIVVACCIAPLLFVGGLVTSTNSGMAVPDWPNTFGTNMFLYPLGPRTPPDRYLEHAHRLFGTLAGLSSLIALVWVVLAGVRGWPRKVAIAAFILVCIQGALGGGRVWLQTHFAGTDAAAAERLGRRLAFLHGVLAQIVFGLVVALTAYLSPTYASPANAKVEDLKEAKRFKSFSAGLFHSLVIQLVFGAMARHFRGSNHALWSHAGFSLVVVVFASLAGFAAIGLAASSGRYETTLKRVGWGLVTVSIIQFVLGWGALAVRRPEIQAASAGEALLRTAHQANGALFLAFAALALVWSRRLWRELRSSNVQ